MKTDYIGGYGEALAFARLGRSFQSHSDLPYFWPHYLGEKCQTFDFLVELVDAGDKTPFFFVQVKTTGKDYTNKQSPRLRINVSDKDVRRMVAYPAPTYVVGVHREEERAYIVAVHAAMSQAISSMTTAHELTQPTLQRLWGEVRHFWESHDMTHHTSTFLN